MRTKYHILWRRLADGEVSLGGGIDTFEQAKLFATNGSQYEALGILRIDTPDPIIPPKTTVIVVQ